MFGDRLSGQQTEFTIDLLYGIVFLAGFGYLIIDTDPRVAALEGGLVLGYFLRVWEKMTIYERVLQETVQEEAQRQVTTELERQVAPSVEAEIAEQVAPSVEAELERQVGESVQAELDEQVAPSVEKEVEAQVGDLHEEIEREVDKRVDQQNGAMEPSAEPLVRGRSDDARPPVPEKTGDGPRHRLPDEAQEASDQETGSGS